MLHEFSIEFEYASTTRNPHPANQRRNNRGRASSRQQRAPRGGYGWFFIFFVGAGILAVFVLPQISHVNCLAALMHRMNWAKNRFLPKIGKPPWPLARWIFPAVPFPVVQKI